MMTSTTGFEQTKVGDAILSPVVGEVVATSPGSPALGSIGTCFALWEEYAIVPATQVIPVLPGHPLVHSLGLLGLNGLTAYFGMTRIANVKEGETVVVSAAAGGVGHIAGQIARIAGARVIGITGAAEKNRKLETEYGFAHTVNHRSPTFVHSGDHGPCPRCVMTTLPQGDLPKDREILRTAARYNDVHVGVYAEVRQTGMVRRGDAVALA